MWIKASDGNLYNMEHMRDVRKISDEGADKVIGDLIAYGSAASYAAGPKVCLKQCSTESEADRFIDSLVAALADHCVHASHW